MYPTTHRRPHATITMTRRPAATASSTQFIRRDTKPAFQPAMKAVPKYEPRPLPKPVPVVTQELEEDDDDDDYEEFYYPHIEVVEVTDMPVTTAIMPTPSPIMPEHRGDPLALLPRAPSFNIRSTIKKHLEIDQCKFTNKMLDVTATPLPRRRSSTAPAPANRPPIPRGVKMYELDPNIYPEAANARASYENRLKRKQEKDIIVKELCDLRQKHKELENENKLLKIQLSNAGTHANGNDWLSFFRDALIKPGLDLKYAIIFERNHITEEMLGHLTETNLRDMGIRPFGDVISILKHARLLVDHAAREARENGEVPKSCPLPASITAPVTSVANDKKSGAPSYGSAEDDEDEEEEEEDDVPRIITIRSLADLMEHD